MAHRMTLRAYNFIRDASSDLRVTDSDTTRRHLDRFRSVRSFLTSLQRRASMVVVPPRGSVLRHNFMAVIN